MQSGDTCQALFQELAAQFRILLLGRAATSIYGFTTPPTDYEIWLEPKTTAAEWTRALQSSVHGFLHAQLCDPVTAVTLDSHVATDCVKALSRLRISGFEVPLLVFRVANEFNADEFDRVWDQATPLSENLRVPCLLDLFLNKINSGNPADYEDLLFLEQKVRAHLAARLPFCDESEANRLLERYIDPDSLRHARQNPHSAVRNLAQEHLRKFAEKGDPFSTEILEAWDSALNPLDHLRSKI